MNTLKKYIMATSALAVASLPFSAANAAVLASDNFSSYAAPVNLQGLNGGTGFSGGYSVGDPGNGFANEVRNNASSLSYPNYPAVGGNYANLYGNGAFNYFQRTVDVAGAFSAYQDSNNRVGLDGTTLWGSFAYNEVTTGQFWLQGASNYQFNLPTTGSNSLFVFRLTFGAANADTFSLFDNPNLTTFDGTGAATATFNGDFSFTNIVFAVNSLDEIRIDNIVLGNSVTDVVPVPEPSTYALLALGGMMVLFFRRRSAQSV